MSNITEIQQAILALPEADSESGKLDFFVAETREAKEAKNSE